MKRVTLTITDDVGLSQTYSVEALSPYVLPLVFRVVGAVVAANPGEATTIATAFKAINDMLTASAGPVTTRPPKAGA